MRDAYYQSVGNPLQLDRLPTTRPNLELLPPSAPMAQRWNQTFGSISVAAVVATIGIIFYRPPGITWLEPFDLIFAGCNRRSALSGQGVERWQQVAEGLR
jgi:hypothetical protein